MINIIKKLKEKTKAWAVIQAYKPYAPWLLGALSFAESSFFPIPPDVLMAPLIVVRKNKWFRYALITTVTSVLGAILGYVVGAFLFNSVGQQIIDLYNLQDSFQQMQYFFENNAFLTMFVSAFTIIPFKVFTISGGIFRINIVVFILASIVGRGLRFFLVAWLMNRFGKRVATLVYKYLSLFVLFVIAIIILVLFLV